MMEAGHGPRHVRTHDAGVIEVSGVPLRCIFVTYYDGADAVLKDRPDVYYITVSASVPDIEVRRLRAKIRSDWREGVKAAALLGRPFREESKGLARLRKEWKSRQDR